METSLLMSSIEAWVRSGRGNPSASQRILYVGLVFFLLVFDFQPWDIFIGTPFISFVSYFTHARPGEQAQEHSVRATSKGPRNTRNKKAGARGSGM